MIRLNPRGQSTASVLAGAREGRQALALWIEHVGRPADAEPAYIDFTGVEVVTASFLRESVFAFRDYCRRFASTVYPVLANISEAIEEEVAFFAIETGDAVWVCELQEDGTVENMRLIGRQSLEAGQQRALEYIEQHGHASAPDLRNIDKTVGPTAWNNRLAALSGKGLLVEERQGKTKIFRTVWSR
jgi:hypothetical protein